MLKKLYPRVHRRYSSLPVLGPVLDGFVRFLVDRGYPQAPTRCHVRATRHVDARLQERGYSSIDGLTRSDLRSCAPPPGRSQDEPSVAAAVRLLEMHFDERGVFPPPDPPGPKAVLLADYVDYLEQVRGLATSTVSHHVSTVSELIAHLGLDDTPCFADLSALDIEGFVCVVGQRVSRATLQHVVAQLRSFLRYLTTRGEAPVGLDTQIDTPRVYRGEKLPRSLPWETVQALLEAVDRTTPLGLRDYAMLALIATYGLRASEVVGLELEHVEWRARRLLVPQRKTTSPLLLPLTDAIGDSLTEYLRRGRPPGPYRAIFVRHRAPAGTLEPTAVGDVFQAWSRRSGLTIPFQGPHCLRHSYAVHLLRQGVSLKSIGDVLGHRNAESTCVYLRLAVEDLRTVPLDLPMAKLAVRS